MSFTTASNYYNSIDTKFPVKGQDNDSQGFRDNWTNIYRSLKAIDDRADNLEKNAVLVENTTTNFLGNTIEDVNLRNYSGELYDNSELYGRIEIDYTLANYQKIEVPQGDHQIEIINWPSSGKVGTLTLEITPTGDGTLNFIDGISLGPEINPFAVNNDATYIFDLWHEGGAESYFVKNNNALSYTTSTEGAYGIFSTLYIGDLNRADERNKFTVNTGTNTNLATVVTRTTSTTRKANLALVPHRVNARIGTVSTLNAPGHVELNTTTNSFSEIAQNATFNFSGSTTTYFVNTATGNMLSIKRLDGTPLNVGGIDSVLSGLAGQVVTFTNPIFDLQDTVVTLTPTNANTSTGVYTNYKGNIYADKNRLEVTFDNYGHNNTNTFVITTTGTDLSNTGTDVVSAAFVHDILPFGSVIMWYGQESKVPTGWSICDGSDYVFTDGSRFKKPDLTNKFVVGADGDWFDSSTFKAPSSTILTANTTTGGYTDAIIPDHSHSATASFAGSPLEDHTHEAIVNDPGHLHKFQQYELINNGERDNNSQAGENKLQDNTEVAYTGITVDIDPPLESPVPEGTVTVTVGAAPGAESVEGKNIPPFTALFYIIKVSGWPGKSGINIY
jgi:hypothetical protein